MKKTVIVILGQTATGKSAYAVKLALRLRSGSSTKNGGEIISADSRQVYKYLDIGTGKVTIKEMRGIPHHLLDVANPKRKFTVVQYKKLAEKKIEEIIARGHVPIICGGTGFYIEAVTKGIVLPDVKPNPKLRKQLARKSAIALFLALKKLDPIRAKNIDPKNKVRIIRAIEITKTLGKVPKVKKIKSKYNFEKIGLYLPAEILKQKIEKRVKKMFKDGLLKEIEELKKIGISEKRLAELGFEYNNPTVESVISETIKYAKRQMTWFKRDPEIKWFNTNLLK